MSTSSQEQWDILSACLTGGIKMKKKKAAPTPAPKEPEQIFRSDYICRKRDHEPFIVSVGEQGNRGQCMVCMRTGYLPTVNAPLPEPWNTLRVSVNSAGGANNTAEEVPF